MRMRVGNVCLGFVLAACGSGTDRGEGLFGGDAASSEGGTGDGSPSGGSASDAGLDDGGADSGVKFDTPPGSDEGGSPGDCNCGNAEWSYVWVANSGESTVSKINTRTLEEEGRYLTRPDGAGNPSRTSVSVDGRAVVVANRHTGIVKIWARPEFCEDRNGTPGIQTSTGPDDVLPWGEDDCIAWYTAFDDMTVQRPVQWTPGTGKCHEDQKVWTVTGQGGIGPGMCGAGGVWVHRLDGESGEVEDTVHLTDAEFSCSPFAGLPDANGTGLGAYGGAVDAAGNFWFHGFGNGKLARIDFATLEVDVMDGGGYGITVDTHGRVWLSSNLSRFDYTTGERVTQNISAGGGLAEDLQGRMWAAQDEVGVVWVDLETLAIGDTVALPGSGNVKGVSVDIDGYVWAVRQGDPSAYRIDPDTYEIESYTGLSQPYTYSDMTGGAIQNVACNPPVG